MIDKRIVERHHETFESIRQFDTEGNEFWIARQLAKVLEYSEYRHFVPVVERAKEACRNSGHLIEDHFEGVLDMVDIGSGAKRKIADIRLSRYACYLIVQNGDPSKAVIANGQTYFALQARRQELRDDEAFAQLSEDEKRLAIRNERLSTTNTSPLPPRSPASKRPLTMPFSKIMVTKVSMVGEEPRTFMPSKV